MAYPRLSHMAAWWPELGAAALMACLALPNQASAPGLHGDEAWVMLRALDAAPPTGGMNYYTGALHVHTVSLVLALFGPSVAALRALSVMLNLAALVLLMRTAHHLDLVRSPAWRFALGAVVGTAPVFVILARFGVEITSLGRLLVFAGLWAFARAARASPRYAAAFVVVGGVLWGLAIYNHAIALAVPPAACAAFLALRRGRLIWRRDRVVAFALAGLAFGLLPRLLAWRDLNRISRLDFAARATSFTFIGDLPDLPGVLSAIWDGSALFARFVGRCELPVPPYPLIFLSALIVAVWHGKRVRATLGAARGALVAWIVLTALVLAAAPSLALRYFELPVLGLCMLLVLATQRLGDAAWVRYGLAGVVALNVLFVVCNYHIPLATKGASASTFPLGSRLIETSNHFLRTDSLYQALVEHGAGTVLTEAFIAWPLQVYDWRARRLNVRNWSPSRDLSGDQRALTEHAVRIYYEAPTPFGYLAVFDASFLDIERRGDVTWRRDRSYPPDFVVLVAEPSPPDP